MLFVLFCDKTMAECTSCGGPAAWECTKCDRPFCSKQCQRTDSCVRIEAWADERHTRPATWKKLLTKKQYAGLLNVKLHPTAVNHYILRISTGEEGVTLEVRGNNSRLEKYMLKPAEPDADGYYTTWQMTTKKGIRTVTNFLHIRDIPMYTMRDMGITYFGPHPIMGDPDWPG